MSGNKMLALVLVIGGVLALVYGGFSYTKKTDNVDLGIVQFSVKEKERVNVPLWIGVAAIAGGVGLLAFSSKRA